MTRTFNCAIILSAYFFLLTGLSFAGVTVSKSTVVKRVPGIFAGNPRPALNTASGKTLLVWERSEGTLTDHSLWGRFLRSNGSPAGKAFKIVNGPNTWIPDLAYNSAANEFVLVYANDFDNNGRFETFAQRLNKKGRPAGKPVLLSDPGDPAKEITNNTQKVVYDAQTNSYIVLWQRSGLKGAVADEGVYGCVLAADLSFIRPPALLKKLSRVAAGVRGPSVKDLEIHPVSGKLLITGHLLIRNFPTNFSWNYFIASTAPGLQSSSLKLKALKKGTSAGAAPDCQIFRAPDGSLSVFFTEQDGIFRRSLDSNGLPTGSISPAFANPLANTKMEFPAFGVDQRAANVATPFVIGIQGESSTDGIMWLQPMDGSGNPQGEPQAIESDFDAASQPKVVALPAGGSFAVVYREGVQRSSPPGDESSGINVLKIKISR